MTLAAILSDPAYPRLKSYVLTHTGLEYYAGKDDDFASRLSRRLSALGITSCSAYLELLGKARQDPPEIDALVGELTIGETYFFRQTEQFELLRSVIIPDLLHRNRAARQLRIWSAGCAIGAEPYSIAILLQREFGSQLRGWNVDLLGTDINVDFLARARKGSFSQWALRDIPEAMLACCFERAGSQWILNPEFRKAVTFRYHNLTDDLAHPSPDGLPFDLILCRNVMIYFGPGRIRALGRRFYLLLNEGGWLLPGYAEFHMEMFLEFDAVCESKATVYRKPSGTRPAQPPVPWQFRPDEISEEKPDFISAAPLFGAPLRDIAAPCAEAAPLHAVELVSASRAASERLENARVLADQGREHEAVAICRGLLDEDALNAPAHFTLGLILAHGGSVESALAHLKRAIYVDRRFALAHYYLGTVLQRKGNGPGARKAFENALELLRLLPPEEPLEHGGGITGEELQVLARMHRELTGK